MNKSIKAAISLDRVRIRKINYLVNDDFSYDDNPVEVEVEFSCGIGKNDENKKAQVSLQCSINRTSFSKKPFMLDVDIEGLFSYKSELEKDLLEKMLTTNALAILFPYLRATISTITVNCGVEPIVLPTLNIVELIKAKKLFEEK